MALPPSDLPSERTPVSRNSERNNTAAIHGTIRDEILSGQLRGGTVLSQVRLAQDFGVSRGPVREALRLLQREGLVEAELNRRVRVADFSIADLEQLYAMRILNETLSVTATVPRLSKDELDGIGRMLTEMDALAGVDMDGWEAAHRAFHHGLMAHAGSRLLSLVEDLSDHAERYRRAYIASDRRAFLSGSADHRQIYEAANRADATGAGTATAEHLARTAITLIGNRAPNHDPALVRGALQNVLGGIRGELAGSST
jgi:DNA-binding GntR family transcriptional regulator